MDIRQFEKWASREFNINLSAYKSNQLHRRIFNLMSRVGVENIDDYVKILKHDNTQREKFVDFITINVTEFFRNPEIFNDFIDKMRDELNCQKTPLKIWSAACSNGAEPYSIAIALNEMCPNIEHKIIATDVDKNILKKAVIGEYFEYEIKNVKKDYINKYFTKKDDKYYISDLIKSKVQFNKHDLLSDPYESNFDIIVCRNVTIYFKNEAKDLIYKKFSNSLKKGGLLFVGATESIYEYKKINFEKSSTFIYRKV